jgi:hypothetical protein
LRNGIHENNIDISVSCFCNGQFTYLHFVLLRFVECCSDRWNEREVIMNCT